MLPECEQKEKALQGDSDSKEKRLHCSCSLFNSLTVLTYDAFFHLIVQPIALVDVTLGAFPWDTASMAAST